MLCYCGRHGLPAGSRKHEVLCYVGPAQSSSALNHSVLMLVRLIASKGSLFGQLLPFLNNNPHF